MKSYSMAQYHIPYKLNFEMKCNYGDKYHPPLTVWQKYFPIIVLDLETWLDWKGEREGGPHIWKQHVLQILDQMRLSKTKQEQITIVWFFSKTVFRRFWGKTEVQLKKEYVEENMFSFQSDSPLPSLKQTSKWEKCSIDISLVGDALVKHVPFQILF